MPTIRGEFAPPNNDLENTVRGFSEAYVKRRKEVAEADAIGNIYRRYQKEGGDIQNAIFEMQSNADISPTMRVNQASQLNEIRKTNVTAQKEVHKEAKKMYEENIIREEVNKDEFKNKSPEEQHATLVNRGVTNKSATEVARVTAAGKRENRLSEAALVKGWDSIIKPINKQLESITLTPEEKKELRQQRDQALEGRNADIRRFKKGDHTFLPGYAAENASVLAQQKGPIQQPISKAPEQKQKPKTGIAGQVQQQVDQAVAQEEALQTEVIQVLNTSFPPEKEKGEAIYLPAERSPDHKKHKYISDGKTWVLVE